MVALVIRMSAGHSVLLVSSKKCAQVSVEMLHILAFIKIQKTELLKWTEHVRFSKQSTIEWLFIHVNWGKNRIWTLDILTCNNVVFGPRGVQFVPRKVQGLIMNLIQDRCQSLCLHCQTERQWVGPVPSKKTALADPAHKQTTPSRTSILHNRLMN